MSMVILKANFKQPFYEVEIGFPLERKMGENRSIIPGPQEAPCRLSVAGQQEGGL
jgi:hypothetical protein